MSEIAKWSVPAFIPPGKPEEYNRDMGTFNCPINDPVGVDTRPRETHLWQPENSDGNSWWCDACEAVHTQAEWTRALTQAREVNRG